MAHREASRFRKRFTGWQHALIASASVLAYLGLFRALAS